MRRKRDSEEEPNLDELDIDEAPGEPESVDLAAEKKRSKELRKEATAAQRTPEQWQAAAKSLVRMFYTVQRLRMQTAGRHLAAEAGEKVRLHAADLDLLRARAEDLHRQEKSAFKDIQNHLETHPFYTNTLCDKKRFRGLGPAMSAVLLSEINIARCNTVSQLWSYSMGTIIPAQRCGNCSTPLKMEDGVLIHRIAPIDKTCKEPTAIFDSGEAARPVKGEKLKYNKFLKTKLLGVLAPCFIKLKSPYAKIYYDYKHRKASAKWGRSPGHRHQAAMRAMVKQFLIDLYVEWRTYEGLPVRPPYAEEYLGKVHQG